MTSEREQWIGAHRFDDPDDNTQLLYDAMAVADRNPVGDDVWVDEHGTTWTRPTAWAYAQVCKANEKKRQQLETTPPHPAMREALEKIAGFAPGNGDVCEIIARIARAALAQPGPVDTDEVNP